MAADRVTSERNEAQCGGGTRGARDRAAARADRVPRYVRPRRRWRRRRIRPRARRRRRRGRQARPCQARARGADLSKLRRDGQCGGGGGGGAAAARSASPSRPRCTSSTSRRRRRASRRCRRRVRPSCAASRRASPRSGGSTRRSSRRWRRRRMRGARGRRAASPRRRTRPARASGARPPPLAAAAASDVPARASKRSLDLKHELNVVRHQLQTEQAHADSMKLKAEEAVRTAAAKVALLTRELDDAPPPPPASSSSSRTRPPSAAPSPSPKATGARGARGRHGRRVAGGTAAGERRVCGRALAAHGRAIRPSASLGPSPRAALQRRQQPRRCRPPRTAVDTAAAPLAVGDADGSSCTQRCRLHPRRRGRRRTRAAATRVLDTARGRRRLRGSRCPIARGSAQPWRLAMTIKKVNKVKAGQTRGSPDG